VDKTTERNWGGTSTGEKTQSGGGGSGGKKGVGVANTDHDRQNCKKTGREEKKETVESIGVYSGGEWRSAAKKKGQERQLRMRKANQGGNVSGKRKIETF